jgi:hypothetical protein
MRNKHVLAISLFLFGIAARQYLPESQNTPPAITWSPPSVEQILAPGTSCNTTLTLASTQVIQHATLELSLAPELMVQVTPRELNRVEPGVTQTVQLVLRMPGNISQTDHTGTLALQTGQSLIADSLKLHLVAVPILPNATPTTAPVSDAYTLIDEGLARGELTIDDAALYRIYALFASPRLPCQYYSPELIHADGLGAFMYAFKDWDKLKPETQKELADFVTPKQITVTVTPAPSPTN